MSEHNYEQEINIGRVFYRIFRDWRKIFVVAMVITVIVGAGNFALKRIKMSSADYFEKAEEDYERQLAAFYARGETLQREFENLEETRRQREEYNISSVLMKINPFREFNASLQLYVSTDYQIMPELTYQNPDVSNRILRSYITYMTNGDMYQYIMEHLTEPLELRYLQEILSVSVDYDSCMLTLGVRHVNAESCEEVLRCALEGIMAKKAEITSVIGEHGLDVVNQAAYETVNLDLDSLQKSNQQYMLDLSINLQAKAEEYNKWQAAPEPQKEYTVGWLLKDSIKKMILGFLIGAVLVAVFIAFCYIMSDKLQDAKDLKKRFGLRVIAQLPKVHKKRVWVGFDRLFARMGGLALKESDARSLAAVAAQSVRAELVAVAAQGADGVSSTKPQGIKLAFTGNLAAEEITKFLSAMRWDGGCSVQSVPSILSDSSAVPAVMAADYVILVEKQEESRYSQIERELEQLAAWKKRVLGFVVVGVDAVP